jgi:rare lipoprotein A
MSPKHSTWYGRIFLFAGTVLATTVGMCGISTAQHDSVNVKPTSRYTHWFQFGRASWYGKDFQGQTTASGAVFDMYAMTCAHRSLPLGALIRVTNLRNHRSVVVQVNDRGPLIPGRVVDLSYAAAKVLGFSGVSRVRLDMIDPSPTPDEVAQITWPEVNRR